MRVLVTGATGGLGLSACETLLSRGCTVRGTGRQASKMVELVKQGLEFTAVDLALADPKQLATLVEGVDCIWHCAALSSPWGQTAEFMACNVTATQRLLDAALKAGVRRFVHVSTPAVYFDYTHHLNVPESYLPERFVNEYARTKHLAEREVHLATQRVAGEMTAVILRPRALFGPKDQVLIPRLLRVAQERGGSLPLPRGGRTLLDLTYLDNVVEAMWLASSARLPNAVEVLNISNDEPCVLADVLQRLSKGLGGAFTIKALPYPVVAAAARLMEWRAGFTGKEPALTRYSVGALAYDMTLDITRAKAVLGYQPVVSMDEGLARTVAALKGTR